MNKTYRLIWNELSQSWVPAPEGARARGKRGGGALRLAALSVALLATGAAQAQALPSGGQIVAGSGSIAQSGNTLTITQTSDKLAANWQSFSIGAGQSVNFVQPGSSAIALNRVLGSEVSTIQGALNANGQVFLVNPNGVLFTSTAQVNVGGLVASTLNLSDADFMAGRYRFSGDSAASVVNAGRIQAGAGGNVALIAARISNSGSITTGDAGRVQLGAGRRVLLDLGGPAKLEVEEGALNALIEQGGAIRADGGLIYLTARSAGEIAGSVIKHTGTSEARTLASGAKGEIYLLGDLGRDSIQVGGTLDASAPAGGDGGFIETSASRVRFADDFRVSTLAAQGRTGKLLIDPQDVTIAASGGDATGAALSAMLEGTSVEIFSVDGGSAGNGDIFIKDVVSWNAATTLNLHAQRNIYIDASVTAGNAAGKLALYYGLANVAAGNSADYYIGQSGKVNLQAGDNFSTQLGSDGPITHYTVITSLGAFTDAASGANTLQGLAHASKLGGNYVLGADIDASATAGWDGGLGFMPIGTVFYENPFRGSFHGLGHSISNLTVNRGERDYVGLFGSMMTYTQAEVRDLALRGLSIAGSGEVGGLAGMSRGYQIKNVSVSGQVSGVYDVGGLVGWVYGEGSIDGASVDATVSGSSYVGGLVGNLYESAQILRSQSAGAVSGDDTVGGLVGYAGSGEGGEVRIEDARSSASVSGISDIGGLVGLADGMIMTRGLATGRVTGTDTASTGAVIGNSLGADISSSLWDTQTTGQSQGAGQGSFSGAEGKTTAQLQQLTTYAGWSIATSVGASGYPSLNHRGSGVVWTLPDGSAAAQTLLTYTLPTLTDLIYKGSAYDLSTLFGSLSFGGTSNTLVAGTDYAFVFNGNPVSGFTNAGSYGGISLVLLGGAASQYSFAGSGNTLGSVSIIPAQLSLSGLSALGKVYDGTIAATLAGSASLGGVLGSDAVTLAGTATGSFADANAGTGKTVTVGGLSLTGAAAGNYTLSPTTLSASITPKALTLTGLSALGKTYDGTSAAALGGSALLQGVLGSDAVALNGGVTASFSDANAGTGKAVTLSGLGLVGAAAANYTLSPAALSADITPRALTLVADAASKVYGEADPTFAYRITGGSLVAGDSLGGSLGRVAGENVGSYAISAAGLANPNYAVSVVNGTLTITPRALTIAADAASKVYGEADPALGWRVTAGSLVQGDSLAGALTRVAGENVGSYKIDASALANGNYLITAVDGTLSITPRAITVAADRLSKVYGEVDPTLGWHVTAGSLVQGDSLAGALTRVAGENVGSYKIDASALANGNYLITAVDGTLSISPRALTVTADNAGKVYGEADPTLGWRVTAGSLVNGDSLTGVLTRVAGENAGSYKIDASALANGNYAITAVNGTLSITPRALTVTADNVSKIQGEADPGLSWRVTGGSLVGGDSLAGVLTREAGEEVGSYRIDASALANGNYVITAVNGTLSILHQAVGPAALQTAQASGARAGVAPAAPVYGAAASQPQLQDSSSLNLVPVSADGLAAALTGGGRDISGALRVLVVDGGLRLPALASAPVESRGTAAP